MMDGNQILQLPTLVRKLSNLKKFILDMYGKLETLPNTISEFKRVQRLNLGPCNSLQILPFLISNLISLQIFIMVDCDQLV